MKNFFLSYFNHYRGITLFGWLSIFSALINSGASVAIIFLALYLTKQFHYAPILIGFVVTGYGIGAMLGALSGGLLCDYFPAQKICIAALFVNAIVLLTIPLLKQYYAVMSAVFLMGVSNYAFSPANRISIMSTTESGADQMRMSSLRYMMVNLGIGVYTFAGGRIVEFGYNWLFILNGMIILVLALALALYFKYQKQETIHGTGENTLGMTANLSFFLLVYIGLLLITLIFSQLRITYPLYLHHYYQLHERLFSNIFLVNTVLIVILQVPLSNFLQKFNPLLTSGLGALLIGIGIGSTFFGSTYEFAMLLCIVWTLGEILFFSTLQALIYERADIARKGKYMGIAQLIAAFANIIGPVTGSWLYGFDQAKWLWLSCLLCGLFTILIHVILYNKDYPKEGVVLYE